MPSFAFVPADPPPVPLPATPARPKVHFRLSSRFRGLCAPGSTPAQKAGCTCPAWSNRHGRGAPASAWGERGRRETLWLLDEACPAHGLVEFESPGGDATCTTGTSSTRPT